jgi:hypothetical protein
MARCLQLLWRYLTIWASIILILSADFKTDLHSRLLDIVHADQKLYLVFEFLDVDLKRYIETSRPLKMDIVKVRYVHPLFICSLHILNCDQTQFISLFSSLRHVFLSPIYRNSATS